MLPLAVLHTGSAHEEVAARHGGYIEFFERLAGNRALQWQHLDGVTGEHLEVRSVAGLVITGSAASMTDPAPWALAGLDLIDRAARAGTPVLGVCFGHQMIAAYAGARVINNPRGWEAGTQPIEVTDHGSRDPLLRGIPARFDANQMHEDVVDETSLPRNMQVLARNPQSAVQAIAVGDHVRGVQFHPEFDGPIMRSYLEARRATIGSLADSDARDCPQAVTIFHNFIDSFAARA